MSDHHAYVWPAEPVHQNEIEFLWCLNLSRYRLALLYCQVAREVNAPLLGHDSAG